MGESTGLPERMIMETAIQSMGLAELTPFDLDKKVIEYAIAKKDRLSAMSLESFADLLSTDAPAPGGGSVAAFCAALSAALTAMVSNLTINKKGYESVQNQVREIAPQAQDIKLQAIQLIDEDTDAFNAMMDASRLPKKTEEEIALREQKIEEATKQAILVPFHTLEIALQALKLADEVAKVGNMNALSDAGTAALTALTAAKAANYNILINLPQIKDEAFKEDINNRAMNLLQESETLASQIESFVSDRLKNA
jgi:glutamate formiminotransferase/formiminotetrahydrofolate cyclodeaminase